MPCLGKLNLLCYYLNLLAAALQPSIQASSISKSILAATQQMNTSDMCLGNPAEQQLWNETTGGEDQVSIQQQTEKSSSLL